MSRGALLGLLLLAGCAAPWSLVGRDGFVLVKLPDHAAVQQACERLAGHPLHPVGGCYHLRRDVGVVGAGDAVAERHEICHHVQEGAGTPPSMAEAYCTRRWSE